MCSGNVPRSAYLEATAGTRLCHTFSPRQLCIKRCIPGILIHTSSPEELVSGPTSSQSFSIQSKSARSLRGSLRNLTWNFSSPPTSAASRNRKFRRRVFSETSVKDDWLEDFYLITREDTGLSPASSTSGSRSGLILVDNCVITKGITLSEHISPPSSATLPPLIIPEDAANRLSSYTSESPTPTLTEFAHLTSSFPLPPSHIPTRINLNLPSDHCE